LAPSGADRSSPDGRPACAGRPRPEVVSERLPVPSGPNSVPKPPLRPCSPVHSPRGSTR